MKCVHSENNDGLVTLSSSHRNNNIISRNSNNSVFSFAGHPTNYQTYLHRLVQHRDQLQQNVGTTLFTPHGGSLQRKKGRIILEWELLPTRSTTTAEAAHQDRLSDAVHSMQYI